MTSWESQLSPQETSYYNQLFQTASKSQEGIVTGTEAVRFFASSGVPNQILSEIWEAADRDKVGYLTPENFAIALKLIACAQHGKDANANVLSTAVPLPQFEGVAPPVSTNNTGASSTPITAAEREKYLNIFKVHQPVNGVLDGNTAKNVFVKSKLPMETLGQIWNLADTRQSGTLNQAEFIIAMHYIAKLMDGSLSTLPDKLPPAVFQSANAGSTTPSPLMRNITITSPSFRKQSTMTPPQRAKTIDSLGNLAFGSPAPVHETPAQQWDVTAQEKQQFDTYFDKIDSQKTGLVQGKEAVEFFNNSRLPDYDLAHIWDLADIQQRGALSREEFAVAMHLIHKRLAGDNLPQTLPKSLIPPTPTLQHQPQIPQQSPFGNSPMVQPRKIEAAPRNIFDDNASSDLLGDFSDNQVSHETNQVNLLQNQISSLSSQTTGIQQQKVSAENALEQLLEQKKELEAQLTNVRMSHEASVKDLNEIQETVRREEGDWDRVRGEYDAAQQQLSALQNEIAQTKQTLENGRAETESLRRRVHEIQEETASINAELEKLRGQTKQQGMMLDINRRQVTAAEQDRAQAKRNLEDYKAAGDFHEDESSSDEEEEEKSPEPEPSVVSTPAINNLFSPFPTSPASDNKTPEVTSPAGGDDFDAIFGNLSVSSTPTTTTQAFDPTSWATPTKSTRGPPPPPPQSRHHRQPSESSTTSSITKKQRAPPPPPPSTSLIPETNNEDDDDFEAAFSGNLPEAKVVAKDDDFADFDDAFSTFDQKATEVKTEPAATDSNTNWASSFGGFDFGENTSTTNTAPATTTTTTAPANDEDWDSIFGTPTTTNKTVQPTNDSTGFDDAFSSFGDDFGKQQNVVPEKKKNNIGIVGDKIEELVKMGFNETEAKDALNRYDQDLEKASNFLLDNK